MIVGVLVLVLVLLAVLAVVAGLVFADRIQGTSMSPTLSAGDRVLVTPGTDHKAARFDVVVADDPTRGNTEIVKRVIALPGDAVQIRGGTAAQFQVLVRPHNQGPWLRADAPVWRPQWQTRSTCCTPQGTKSQYPRASVVPGGSYFVMGDNPDVSVDSRTFGWVRGTSIHGRLGLRIWPLSADRSIGNRPRLVPAG
ncbi:MAG: signal peptidase I [Jatrophihabitans sp.]